MNRENPKTICEQLWRLHAQYIKKLCDYKLNSRSELVEDVVQEVFLALQEALCRGDVIERPKAWLTAVAMNKIHDCYKLAKRQTEKTVTLTDEQWENLPGQQDAAVSFEEVPDAQLEEVKNQVLLQLSEEERELIDLYYGEKIKLKVLAKRYQYSESKMKKQMFYLRQKIIYLARKELNRQLQQSHD